MPTNEQRRAAAKRKLERQLERRETKAKRQRTIALVSAGIVAVIAGVGLVAFFGLRGADNPEPQASGPADPAAAQEEAPPGAAPVYDGKLPPFEVSEDTGANCQYPADEAASKPNKPPRTGKVPNEPAEVSASMSTNQGNIGLMLDNGKSPCTVNSFISLAQQEFFNDTPCHRLTTAEHLSVLQCGDPTGKGDGGPGYRFDNEYPTDQYPLGAPEAQQPVLYPRGTLAMANAGAHTNGSQFFLVYRDSLLPPQYTVFGTIDETGLATLDKIAKAGVKGGAQDGAPADPVMVKSIMLD